MNTYILSIDQGTSGTKCILFNKEGAATCTAFEPLRTHYLESGFVEQQPEEIYRNVLAAVRNCMQLFTAGGGDIHEIKTCGISNQRETFVLWDAGGNPLHDAVVWQCKRSVDICTRLQAADLREMIKGKTGLLPDPYFSGTKVAWLYEEDPLIKMKIDAGAAYFGTIDTWLLYKLTKGEKYYTDYTNASRTLFFNLHTLEWDADLLQLFGLSKLHLPRIKASSGDFGMTDFDGILSDPIPVNSLIGDSHSAAFGEGCFDKGTAKATLGTGCSILVNTGNAVSVNDDGIIDTICWSTEKEICFAKEGIIVSCGSMVEWLKHLGLFANSAETDLMARSVPDNNGVFLVPAFSGMGAPYWDMKRKAEFTGLTFSCTKEHLVRATLETICFQIKEVIDFIEQTGQIRIRSLSVNGGITGNGFVMDFLATLLARPLLSGRNNASGLGTALLAGLKVGLYTDMDDIGDCLHTKEMKQASSAATYHNDAYCFWRSIMALKR
ncbi:FGGY family carbohydrate kinase [Niabella aurantiaca]|uniref:FGGY family carbohydrate kinase n=1 Tax=Niabella aurantiaca TaxID=379900 RepID=UPI0003823461|nr:FGGY family carbohydrate kinase [Niabella aurantiaca]